MPLPIPPTLIIDPDTGHQTFEVLPIAEVLPTAGQIYVPATARALIVIVNTTSYVECTAPVWTLDAPTDALDESAGNGRLTFVGDLAVAVHVACSFSFTSVPNNQTVHWRLGKNGTPSDKAEAQHRIEGNNDVISTSLHLVEVLETGDYISLFARNQTSTGDLFLECANLQVVTMVVPL